MRVVRNAAAGAAFACVLAVVPATAEDLTISYKVTSSTAPAAISTYYLATDKVRHADVNQDTIFELSTGRMIVIDHKKKEYWESTAQEREAFLKQIEAQMKQAQEQMAGMPPAVKERMASMMGGAAAQVKVAPGQATKRIAGYTCQQYTITAGDGVQIEQWVTKDLQFPPQFYDAQKAQFATIPQMKIMSAIPEEMKKIKGFSLGETSSVKMMGMSSQTTREATEVRKGAIPASVFEIPAGYKRISSPFVKGK